MGGPVDWLQRRSAAFALIALLALGVVAWALVHGALKSQAGRDDAAGWELHTVQAQLETQRLFSMLQDTETGERGFLLSADPAYLAPYERGSRDVAAQMDNLAILTRDNPIQQRHLATLGRLVDQRLGLLAQDIETARQSGAAAIGPRRNGEGKRLMDAIRQELLAMDSEESRLLARRKLAANIAIAQARGALYTLLGFAAVLAVIAMAAGIFAVRQARRARLAAQRFAVAEQVQAELGERVEAATRDLRESEAHVRQMQKMEAVGRLTGGIAHDFNNMLAIIIGSLDMAERRRARGEDDIQRCLDSAMDGAKRAAVLTQRLLAFSRQQPLAPTSLDANVFVSGMSELLRHTLGEQVKLETVLAGGLWATKADSHQLENAIVNLAVNARDAMSEGGKLTLETANAHLDDAYVAAHADVTAGQYVMIAVSDTGEGMTSEVVAKAFDPFFTTKGVGKGTGLGLSQVFGFIKQSGGHLKIYSEVGRGTTIKLYLPRHFGVSASQAETVIGAPSTLPDGRSGEIILVVEDEDRVRRMSVDALRDLGYTVRHASDGGAALALLKSQPGVRLLFTDIVMPGMTGRQLADAAHELLPDLQVLYTTGYTRNAVVHDGTIDPGVAFLPKPFTIAQLAIKVRQVIDQRVH
jgi:signal transduction histidine kinase